MSVFWLTILFLSMTLLGSCGCFLLKRSTEHGLSVKLLLRNLNFYFGGLTYFLSAVLNIVLLKYLDYAIVLPLTSVTYVWSMILAHFFLHEKITKGKICGMALILAGMPFLFL